MIQITFYPDVNKDDLDSGVMSHVSWQRIHDDLIKVFGIEGNERLVGITVDHYGIKAKNQIRS